MFEYVDLHMKEKPKGIRHVILNIYGGESLHHPNIVDILMAIRSKYGSYADRWSLTVTTTTNAIITEKKLQQIIPFIDEFTCSYHTENSVKQKHQFKKNLLTIRDSGKRLKTIILMHSEPDLFHDAEIMMEWLTDQQIKYLPRQLDHSEAKIQFNYRPQQVSWFKKLYQEKSYGVSLQINEVQRGDRIDLSASCRACCGGRSLCHSQKSKQRKFAVQNTFSDWYCSVYEFFLYVKQVNGEIYVNKDCKMNFAGSVGPIGNLNQVQELLRDTRQRLSDTQNLSIQCKKTHCWCGLCAPKAKNKSDFNEIMEKYRQ